MMKDVWVISAARTPIGSFLGQLASLSATDLGAQSIKSALSRAKVDGEKVDEVLMGCVLTSGLGQAPARQAALKAGLPERTPCTTVGKVCGSGLKAVWQGYQAIKAGDAKLVVCGGMESMSNAPFLIEKMRGGQKFGHGQLIDSMIKDGLWDVYNDFHMGKAAELCATDKNVSREAQDAYAKKSYQRAQAANKAGFFEAEIEAVEVPSRKGVSERVEQDEDMGKANFEKFPALKPVFQKDGTVTAANASNLNDGAAALVLADAEWAKSEGLQPLAVIRGGAQSARAPEWFTMAPADAIKMLCQKLSWQADQVDLFEINEAFSVVALAVSEDLGLDLSKVNVQGGAVALGHPIGASGARILVTLIYSLIRLEQSKGVASLCIGGGEGIAVGVERV